MNCDLKDVRLILVYNDSNLILKFSLPWVLSISRFSFPWNLVSPSRAVKCYFPEGNLSWNFLQFSKSLCGSLIVIKRSVTVLTTMSYCLNKKKKPFQLLSVTHVFVSFSFYFLFVKVPKLSLFSFLSLKPFSLSLSLFLPLPLFLQILTDLLYPLLYYILCALRIFLCNFSLQVFFEMLTQIHFIWYFLDEILKEILVSTVQFYFIYFIFDKVCPFLFCVAKKILKVKSGEKAKKNMTQRLLLSEFSSAVILIHDINFLFSFLWFE